MHPSEVVAQALTLRAQGLPVLQVAKRLGLPPTTVHTWLQAESPEALLARRRAGPSRACAEGRCPSVVGLDEEAYAYLFGLYLGDGCVTAIGGSYRLEVACCGTYPNLLEECARAVGRVLPHLAVHRRPKVGYTAVVASSLHLACLFPQLGPGPKHERTIALAEWQRTIALDRHADQLVRGLLHSDGCRTANRVTRHLASGTRTYSYPRYFFSNRSTDILALFIEACERLGVVVRANYRHSLSVADARSVARLDDIVGPKS
jgi:hypothetical protein